jgi:hypothetical protein
MKHSIATQAVAIAVAVQSLGGESCAREELLKQEGGV